MNVTELSSNLYHRAGISSTDILNLRSTRRSDRPASLGVDRSDGPHFSEVLAALTEKHQPQAFQSAAPENTAELTEAAPALSVKDARSLLRDALNADSLPDELVRALTDDSGEISDKLLDLIFQEDEEDELTDAFTNPSSTDTINRILTDQREAQSYLTTQSGRDLMVALAQNSISSIIANT
jgi:hypothetical protein